MDNRKIEALIIKSTTLEAAFLLMPERSGTFLRKNGKYCVSTNWP
jgi:hypothetical protein